MSNTMELVVIPASNLPTILAADDKDVLGKLAAELAGFEADVTTVKGRAEIASKAHKVATAKMDLIRLGKSLTECWRDQTKAVNAECRVIEERMDQLRDQVRAPLDEYQDREKRRVEGHDSAINDFTFIMGAAGGFPSSQEVATTIDQVTDMHAGRNWEEFLGKAAKAKRETLDALRAVYQTAVTREDEAEAARIAAEEQAERQREAAVLAQIAREERIAAEAAERARVAAEEEAARKAREAEERAQAVLREQAIAAERERAEALRREREATEAILRAEREKQAAIDQAARDRLAAIERQRVIEEREHLSAEQAETAREAAARQAERDQIAAVEAERKRVAAEEERVRKEDERRAADRAHRAKINHQALEDLMECCQWPEGTPLAEALARKIVTAIAKGEIRNIKVQY